jgi:hypothetical protein
MALLSALTSADNLAYAETAAGPDPVIREWPRWPYQTTCHGLPFDPVTAFSSPTDAENGSRPSEIALREYLSEMESWPYPLVPSNNWRLLVETSEGAEFASGRLSKPGGPSVISVDYEDGVWKRGSLSSGCTPESIVGEIRAISWRLAADQKALRRGTKTIEIDLGPGPCASGRSQNARALKPIFKQMGKKLLLIMRLRPLPPGVYTCEGITDPPLRVRLPGRLGKRKLFDGGTYPPADVVEIWGDHLR